MTHNSKPVTAFVVLLVVGLGLSVSFAQTAPQVILTWQANNFYPSDYEGKAFATQNTPVVVSAEVLKNGKLIDLSRANFTWYLDEKSAENGEGLKDYSFNVSEAPGEEHFVRTQIKLGEDLFENSIRIPVSSFLAVVHTPYSKSLVRAGDKISLEAIPYFFNISSLNDLKFLWEVSGQRQEGVGDNGLALTVGTPIFQNQKTIQITVFVQNRKNLLEFSSVKKILPIQ